MNEIKILIVEDEALIAMDLAAGLERDGYRIAGIADSAEEAKDIFLREEVDIVLMDIHLHGDVDGVAAAAELGKIRAVPLIYLSAFTDTATVERVKGTQPAAFLSKPYSLPNVRIAIELALSNFAVAREKEGATRVIAMGSRPGGPAAGGPVGAGAGSAGVGPGGSPEKELILQLHDSIFVKNNVQFVKIALLDILYLEADNNYVNLHTAERKFALRISMALLLEKITYPKLVRIHRSYAVNIERMSSFSDGEVCVGKVQLPLGRNYREEFLDRFNFK